MNCNNRLQDFRCNSPMTCEKVGRCAYLPRKGDPGDPSWERVGSARMDLLTVELVPAGQFGDNLRSRLPKAEWDALRRATYAAAGHRCEVCGGKGSRHPVECHERWEYDELARVQKLVGLIALCPRCHEVKHAGLASARGRLVQVLEQLMRVNGWSADEAGDHVELEFRVWNRRSREAWTLDLDWLDRRGSA